MPVSRSLAATVATLLFLVACSSAAGAQEPVFDPVAGAYEYVQPDDAGDAVAEGNPEFGDITSLGIHLLEDGSLLLQMKFVDLEGASGDLRYCAFFQIGGASFQAGLRGRFVNGAADPSGQVAVTSCTWTDLGTTVGTPTLATADDQIHVLIAPSEIEGLSPGMVLTGINVQIGAVVPGVGQGDSALFDELTPTVEPVDFAYRASAPTVDAVDFAVDFATQNLSAKPGDAVETGFDVVNNGSAPFDVELTLEGLPDGFEASFEPAVGTIGPNETLAVMLKVLVPADAAVGAIDLNLNATTSESSRLFPLRLTVTAAEEQSPTPTTEPSQNESAAPLSASESEGAPSPGIFGVLAALGAGVAVLRRRRA